MRYSFLALSFISMIMSTNIVSGSALLDEVKNTEMQRSIFQKVSPKNINVSSLTPEEKEWLYEADLLETLSDLQSHDYSNPEDISRTLGALADFYDYKGRDDLANRMLIQKAELDLKDALRGDEATLGIFNNMIKEKRLKDNYFKDLIKLYQQDPDEFAKGKYKHLIKEDRFKDHVASLVEAYKESGKETLELRKRENVPAIPLYDKVLKLILEERINGRLVT